MQVQEEDAQTLARLGFTGSQAKVYLTLAALGKANAKSIYKCSGVARQDIYRVLDELQEKGLIEKAITKPTEFEAVPIQDGFEILLKRKNNEYKDIAEKTRRLVSKLKTNLNEPKLSDEPTQFHLIPAKEASLQKRTNCIGESQQSVDVVTCWKSFQQMICTQKEDLTTASSRGIKIRVLLNQPKAQTMPTSLQGELAEICMVKNASFFSSKCELSIFDKKELLLITDVDVPFYLDSALLWSNNASFVAMMQGYFDLIWAKSQKTIY